MGKEIKIWEKYLEKIKCPSKFTLRVYGYLKNKFTYQNVCIIETSFV